MSAVRQRVAERSTNGSVDEFASRSRPSRSSAAKAPGQMHCAGECWRWPTVSPGWRSSFRSSSSTRTTRSFRGRCCLSPVWLLLAKLHALYDHDHRVLRHLTVDELPSLTMWATTSTALFALFLAVTLRRPVGG